jgi:hypothetical protein
MFIYIVSLTLQKIAHMTIHNRYSDIELVSPVLFCNCENRYEYHVEKTDTGSMLKINIKFDTDQDVEGILMCKIQMKSNTRTNHRYSNGETSRVMRLLVAWKIKHSRAHEKTILVEYDDTFEVNENRLEQLYNKVRNIPTMWYRNEWLIYDDTILKVTSNSLTYKRDPGLEITISRGVGDSVTIRPMWIDPERQVSSLMIIYSY